MITILATIGALCVGTSLATGIGCLIWFWLDLRAEKRKQARRLARVIHIHDGQRSIRQAAPRRRG